MTETRARSRRKNGGRFHAPIPMLFPPRRLNAIRSEMRDNRKANDENPVEGAQRTPAVLLLNAISTSLDHSRGLMSLLTLGRATNRLS